VAPAVLTRAVPGSPCGPRYELAALAQE
jgi:hypothetical protein